MRKMEDAQNPAVQTEQSNPSDTPYDDAWRTLTTTVPNLLIPMITELFGTHFSEHANVVLNQNEHLFSDPDGRTEKRVTDTNFSILDAMRDGQDGTNASVADGILGEGFAIIDGALIRHYIVECESKAVTPAILVRIVEYSVKSANDGFRPVTSLLRRRIVAQRFPLR